MRKNSSLDSLFILLRVKYANNESFRVAFYCFLTLLGICTFATVCIILAPFLKPLVWAFLIGAVLFPFKKSMSDLLNGWFEDLEANDVNFFYATFVSPFQVLEYFGRFLFEKIKKNWQFIGIAIFLIIIAKTLLFCYSSIFFCISNFISLIYTFFETIFDFLSFPHVVGLLCLHIFSIIVFWSDSSIIFLSVIGQAMWVMLLTYACNFFGALRFPVIMLLIFSYIVSISFYARRPIVQIFKDGNIEHFGNLKKKIFEQFEKDSFKESIENFLNKKSNEDSPSTESFQSEDISEKEIISNKYFKYLFYACFVTFLFRNFWMYLVGIIPLSVHISYKIGISSGLFDYCQTKMNIVWNILKEWAFEHHTAAVPLCLPGFLELSYKSQKLTRSYLKSSIDVVTSVFIIIIMILVFIFLCVFFCVNIYTETIDIAYLGKDLINKTLTDQPDLIEILPANIQNSIDDILDNTHTYVRRRIEQYIDETSINLDKNQTENFKMQVIGIWDRVIQYWFDYNNSNSFGPRVQSDAIKASIEEIVDNTEFISAARKGILGWLTSNTNTIIEVVESVWHIFNVNISIFMSIIGSIFSLLLSSGLAFVELILDIIVFFTTLFYLLSISGSKYAPLKVGNYLGILSKTDFGNELEISISGLLVSLVKCSVFQGVFTWLVHNIFGARVSFLPSAIAAILSAAPFLGSYWCGIPAFLELWLAQDRLYSGIFLMSLLIFVPPFFEQQVRTEIKSGGHPYLAGLAIAGGMYWMGWQGAIFGPLMLSLLIAVFEIVTVTLRQDDTFSESNISPLDENSIKKADEKDSSKTAIQLKVERKTISTLLPKEPIPWKIVSRTIRNEDDFPTS